MCRRRCLRLLVGRRRRRRRSLVDFAVNRTRCVRIKHWDRTRLERSTNYCVRQVRSLPANTDLPIYTLVVCVRAKNGQVYWKPNIHVGSDRRERLAQWRRSQGGEGVEVTWVACDCDR